MMRSKDAPSSRQFSTADLPKSHSQAHILGSIEKDSTTKKPPSPLTLYDYGCLSVKPRSLIAQHRQRHGDAMRPKHRQTSCGFYFPGAQFKHGPYGFSMIDPCLMPPRNWAQSPEVPARWNDESGHARPLDAQALGLKRNRSAGPTISPSVRTTAAHEQRALRAFQVMDKHREEAVLEHARFENAVYEGKWQDPLLETKGELPETLPPAQYDWLALPAEEQTTAEQMAARIIFGLCNLQQSFRGGIMALLAAENRGGPGVLEAAEFRRGLLRLGIVTEVELSLERLVTVIGLIDQTADGRVRLPAVARAAAVARNLRKQQRAATEQLQQQREVFLSTKYSSSLPVDVVKLDKDSKSLYNFERSLEKFRSQQRELLVQHNEHDAEPQ